MRPRAGFRSLGLRYSRWFAPAGLAMLAVALVLGHRLGVLPVQAMRASVLDVVTPVLETVTAPVSAAISSVDGIASFRELRAENQRLKADNQRLMAWYDTALKMQAENQALRSLLNVKADPTIQMLTARVMSDPGGAFVRSILLPVGKSDGVRRTAAVVSGEGLVGRIIDLGQQSSRALLVTDLNSRVPVVVQNTRVRGILAGNNSDRLLLERVPSDSGLAVGQRIVTSGDGGQIPADIPVGVIESISARRIVVRPLADIERLGFVQVVNSGHDVTDLVNDLVGPLRP